MKKKMQIKYIFFGLILFSSTLILKAQGSMTREDKSIDTITVNQNSPVNLPFRASGQEFIAGSVSAINPKETMKFDHVQGVLAALNGRIPGMRGLSIHEFGEALTIIDGIPRPLSSIDLQEIDEITVLKDVNSSILYGVQALNGVIQIKTKRGIIGERKGSVWAEFGVNDPVSYPGYLNSADYMELYNEALNNDGLGAKYSPEDIALSREGANPLLYPDVDYFNSTFLKSMKPNVRVAADFSGGSKNAQYYLYGGYFHEGSLLKLGEGSKEQENRFNIRSNINFKVNDFIKSHLDIVAVYDNKKTINGDFWGNASTLHANLFPLLIDTSRINYQGATLINGRYLLGGTSQYQQHNAYGDLYFGGNNNAQHVTAQFSLGIDVDLRSLLNGLTFRLEGSFDFYDSFNEHQDNTYAVYEITAWDDPGNPLGINKVGSDLFSGTQQVSDSHIIRAYSLNGLLNYAHTFDRKHAVSLSVVPYYNEINETDSINDAKYIHAGFNLNYVYNKKFTLDFSSATVYSVKLPIGDRFGFSPSVSLGWIAVNNDLPNAHPVVNFLKFSASSGIMNTDMMIPHHSYQNFFKTGSSYGWNDGIRSNSTTLFQSVENNNLSYKTIRDINVGIEAGLFDRSFWVDVNLFRKLYSDKVLQPASLYPAYLGGFMPNINYGEDKYSGIDVDMTWSHSFNHFNVVLGANVSYLKTEVVKTDELWEYDYQYRTGKPVGAIFGLESEGLFNGYDDIDSHEVQRFGFVAPGDIKYVDQNNDGIIDSNDEIMIGSNTPDFYGGLNLKLGYKNFTLFGIATARFGSERLDRNPYYWVYGDRKYSEEVLNRWKGDNASSATYPRLTTIDFANNYRNSTFWIRNNSMINISRIQLSYNLPLKKVGELNFFVRGDNLATISKSSERMELNVGSEPQYRSYSIGIKAFFF